MKAKYIVAVVFLIIFITMSQVQAADQKPSMTPKDYVVGPGDVLAISVWNNEALTKTVTVLPDGKIQFPLISEMTVAGKAHAAIEKELEEKLGHFISSPKLSVLILKPASMQIYVVGEVQKPGMFSLNAHISLLQALAMAGGFNEWAVKDKIQIYRESVNKTEVINVSYDAIIKEKKIDQNIRLKRGDVVVVP
jgi:polysaccharide biosynthesis/export protein